MVRVLLVDDHQLLRETLRWRLSKDVDIEVVGEASSAREAVRLAEALRPDVVVLDITLPGESGLIAAGELTRRDRRRRVLFLSMHRDVTTVARALAAGLLAHGLPNHAIAGRLRISVNTVETHRAHILKKLGAHSLSDIVRVAARHGFLERA